MLLAAQSACLTVNSSSTSAPFLEDQGHALVEESLLLLQCCSQRLQVLSSQSSCSIAFTPRGPLHFFHHQSTWRARDHKICRTVLPAPSAVPARSRVSYMTKTIMSGSLGVTGVWVYATCVPAAFAVPCYAERPLAYKYDSGFA